MKNMLHIIIMALVHHLVSILFFMDTVVNAVKWLTKKKLENLLVNFLVYFLWKNMKYFKL
ncbi:hypothetical protein C1646_725459 [Rhizophagus diaphanus]|nr:hypothetical protein C1646_725459 [Rhizophagus diaphanus] [Rhizophagus sp. MUCL 43196]